MAKQASSPIEFLRQNPTIPCYDGSKLCTKCQRIKFPPVPVKNHEAVVAKARKYKHTTSAEGTRQYLSFLDDCFCDTCFTGWLNVEPVSMRVENNSDERYFNVDVGREEAVSSSGCGLCNFVRDIVLHWSCESLKKWLRINIWFDSLNRVDMILRSNDDALTFDTIFKSRLDKRFNAFTNSLLPNPIDYSSIRKWEQTTPGSPKTSLFATRMIECTTRALVKATVDVRYVALSYVWGVDTKYEDARPSKSVIPVDCPLTFEDAIYVTKELGFKYLWIDKYCIDQADPADVANQIPNMDKIYRNADLTLVAATGADAHHGLPGVSTRRLTPSISIALPDRFLVSHKGIRGTRSSHGWIWATRGWTFQEQLLSTKLLYFTESRVIYECKPKHEESMQTVELCDIYPVNISRLLPMQSRRSEHLYFYDLLDGRKIEYKDDVYGMPGIQALVLELLTDGSGRQLTHQLDRLNCVAGILSAIETQSPGTKFLLGSYYNVKTPSTLLISILWRWRRWGIFGEDHNRLKRYPSWTWCGWSSHVNWHSVGHWYKSRDRSDQSMGVDILGYPEFCENGFQSEMAMDVPPPEQHCLKLRGWVCDLHFSLVCGYGPTIQARLLTTNGRDHFVQMVDIYQLATEDLMNKASGQKTTRRFTILWFLDGLGSDDQVHARIPSSVGMIITPAKDRNGYFEKFGIVECKDNGGFVSDVKTHLSTGDYFQTLAGISLRRETINLI